MNSGIITILAFLVFFALTWCISQTIKCCSEHFIVKRGTSLTIKDVFSDGGYPSTHSCTCVEVYIISLFYLIPALNKTSDMFYVVIALIIFESAWCFTTLRDAVGVRLSVQKNAEVLEKTIDSITSLHHLDTSDLKKEIKIKNGHYPLEVFGGVILGIICSFIYIGAIKGSFIISVISFLTLVIYIILSFVILKKRKNN